MNIDKNKVWKMLVAAGLFIMIMNSSATTHLLVRTTEGTSFQEQGGLCSAKWLNELNSH